MESINRITDEKLLSICIPTYNRALVLDLCLKSIITQNGFDNRTEIVILDNNSSDNTKQIAEKYTDTYSNIFYYKNDENIGMEKNILKVLEYGNGKLLKLLNDYSTFSDDKLEEILAIIQSNSDENSILYFQNKSLIPKILTCSDLNSFFRETTYWSTWIGTFSIWRNEFQKLGSTEKFEGLLFPHLLMFLENFQQKKQITIIYEKFTIDLQVTTKGGYNFFDIFIQNFIGKIIHGLYKTKKINFKTLYIVKSSFCSNFLKTWIPKILFEKSSTFSRKNISLIFLYFIFYPQLYFIVFNLLLYPARHSAKAIKNYLN